MGLVLRRQDVHLTRLTACGLLTGFLSTVSLLQGQEPSFVYLHNVTGVANADGDIATVEGQTARALERLGALLAEHGLGYQHVVAANVFLEDARNFRAMNDVYRQYFQNDPPTRATVEVDLPDPDALVQVSVIATSAPTRRIEPRGLKSPELPYSWGVAVGNTLFIAGVTSRSPETYQPMTGDVATQTRRVFGNIGLVLEEAEMDFGDLVSCRVFLEDARRFSEMNEAYRAFVPAADPPARATVQAGLMHPAFEVEIQCIAEQSAARRVVIGEGRQRSRSPFSPAIATGGRLHLAGMVGSGPTGVPADVRDQTRNALENLRATLHAESLSFADVVDTWVYVTDIRQWETVRDVIAEVLPANLLHGTVIGTPLMGSGLLVEVQMTAERP